MMQGNLIEVQESRLTGQGENESQDSETVGSDEKTGQQIGKYL